jgi:hypothetical protein
MVVSVDRLNQSTLTTARAEVATRNRRRVACRSLGSALAESLKRLGIGDSADGRAEGSQ